MKLLLDENLSPKLAVILSETYSDTAHVRNFDLKSAPDPEIWTFAAQNGYTIVTKDADFHHRSFLFGQPPKIIWIRLGNCSTMAIASLLLERRSQIEEFHLSKDSSFLTLF